MRMEKELKTVRMGLRGSRRKCAQHARSRHMDRCDQPETSSRTSSHIRRGMLRTKPMAVNQIRNATMTATRSTGPPIVQNPMLITRSSDMPLNTPVGPAVPTWSFCARAGEMTGTFSLGAGFARPLSASPGVREAAPRMTPARWTDCDRVRGSDWDEWRPRSGR